MKQMMVKIAGDTKLTSFSPMSTARAIASSMSVICFFDQELNDESILKAAKIKYSFLGKN